MSTGKFGLTSIKNGVLRKKHQILTTFGKANETVDVQYDQEWKRFDQFVEVVKVTQKHLTDFIKALTAMTSAETALAECWASIFDTSSSMYNGYAKNIVFTGQQEQLRIQLTEDLKRDMDEPLDNFSQQFKIIKKRDGERTRRKVDSDRLLYDYEKLQRAGKDLEKVEPLRLQSEGMALYYERLNNELKRDIPLLIDDRALFYTPLFANWIFHCHEYYRMSWDNIQVVLPTVQNVDMSTLHTHPSVITSEEASYYNVEIKDATPDDMDAPPMSTQMGGDQGQYDPNQQQYHQQQHQQPYQQQQQPGGYGHQAPYQSQAPAGYPPPQGQYQPTPGGAGTPATRRPPGPPATNRANLPCARALYAFVGQDASELSFSEGEILTVYNQSGEWWDCEVRGRRGLCPANYVQLI